MNKKSFSNSLKRIIMYFILFVLIGASSYLISIYGVKLLHGKISLLNLLLTIVGIFSLIGSLTCILREINILEEENNNNNKHS